MAPTRFKVRWSGVAESRLWKIVAKIGQETPLRAQSFANRILKVSSTLRVSPYRCPLLFEDPSYRFLLIKKFRLVFRIAESSNGDEAIVWIVAILYPYEQFTQTRFFHS